MRKFIFALLLALLVATPASAYIVKSGDTLYGLYGSNWRTVAQQNGITNPKQLKVGTVLPNQGLLGAGGLFGATANIPNSPALVDTYLASGISAVDTSMILANGTTRAGTTLSGYTCFTLDVNTPVVEYVCGTASGTSVTGLLRGVDLSNPNTTSSLLAKVHRRFASVQISDYPALPILARILQGLDSTPGGITFATNTIYFSGTNFGIRQNGTDLQWSIDGFANSYNFTSSSISQLSASSSLGIQVINSLIGINASSTTGGAFGSDGKYYQKIDTSTGMQYTAGSVGIGINTSTLVGLIGTSTPTANKIPIANSSADLESWIKGNVVNMVAGETISTAPYPVYSSSTNGNIYNFTNSITSAVPAYGITNYVGFAVTTGTAGQTIKVQTNGLVSGFSNLTQGSDYALTTTTANGVVIMNTSSYTFWLKTVGVAVSTTTIRLDDKKKLNYTSTAPASPATSDLYITAYVNTGAGIADVKCSIGATSASTVVAWDEVNAAPSVYYGSISCFVPKGYYWSITGATAIYYFPML